MTRDQLIDVAPNVVRLSDYRHPRSDFDIRLEEIARMFTAQREVERAISRNKRKSQVRNAQARGTRRSSA
jgi:hypothetical protein